MIKASEFMESFRRVFGGNVSIRFEDIPDLCPCFVLTYDKEPDSLGDFMRVHGCTQEHSMLWTAPWLHGSVFSDKGVREES